MSRCSIPPLSSPAGKKEGGYYKKMLQRERLQGPDEAH